MPSPKIHYLSLLLLCCLGCTYTGAIRTDIALKPVIAAKQTQKVGLYFTPRLAQAEETTSLVSHPAHTFTYQLGPALVAALTRTIENTYTQTTILAELPQPGAFDRLILFDWGEAQLNLSITAIPFGPITAPGQVNLSLIMQIFDSGQKPKTFTVNGSGFCNRRAGALPKEEKGVQVFAPAFENAIRQVADNAANLLAARVP